MGEIIIQHRGALNLEKCFWYLLAWKWNKGKATLLTSKTSHYSLNMTTENGTNTTEIQRIDPNTSYRTLGVYISPSGSSKGAFQQLKGTVLDYCANIVASKLTRQEILTSFIQYLLPKIRYQPPLLLLSLSDCDKLMSPILTAILPKMHTNRNTSRAIVHGPEAFGGMALPHLHTIQGIDKLKLFLGHLRLKDRTAQLIHYLHAFNC